MVASPGCWCADLSFTPPPQVCVQVQGREDWKYFHNTTTQLAREHRGCLGQAHTADKGATAMLKM